MNRELAVSTLTACKPEMVARFGVVRLALFGSTARGTAGADSDVDVLVRFDGPASARRFLACSSCSRMHWGIRWTSCPKRR